MEANPHTVDVPEEGPSWMTWHIEAADSCHRSTRMKVKGLIKAASCGDFIRMKAMVSNDPSILFGTTLLGNNCLHIASINGHTGFCKDMLEIANSILPGGDFKSLLSNVNCEKETPLLMAITNDQAPLAIHLLECCRKLELRQAILQQDKKGFNALHHAIRSGHRDLALVLIEAEPELSKHVTKYDESPMFIAVMRDFTDISMRLLEIPDSAHGGNRGRHALHAAARNGNRVLTKKIMGERSHLVIQADQDGITPIRMAVSYNKADVLEELLEHGSPLGYEIDLNGVPLLCSAAERGQVDAARVLVSRCPDAPYTQTHVGSTLTCLHIAVQEGHPEFVEFIMRTPGLRKMATIQDDQGRTALHYAVRLCDPRLVAALLSHKSIDTTVVDNSGRTAASKLSDIRDGNKTLDWKEVHVLMLKADPKDDDISLYNLRKGAMQWENSFKSRVRRMSLTREYTSNTSLVAVLLATITFTAAFTLPGGYSTDAGSAGLPIMSRQIAFQAFLVADTLAMCSSFVVAFICLMGQWEDDKFTTHYISVTKKLAWFSYMATLAAFTAGLYTVLASQLHWLALGICSLVASVPILTMFIGQWPVMRLQIRLSVPWDNFRLKCQLLRRGFSQGYKPNSREMV